MYNTRRGAFFAFSPRSNFLRYFRNFLNTTIIFIVSITAADHRTTEPAAAEIADESGV